MKYPSDEFSSRTFKLGISDQEILKFIELQNNKCKICLMEFGTSKETKPNLDHCHKTNTIRGLLCFKCNIGIGIFKDNTSTLLSAIDYLTQKIPPKNAIHLISEFSGCNGKKLNDAEKIKKALEKASFKANMTVLNSFFEKFSPQGVTGGLVLSESHVTIHTWPQYNYAAMDFYTCGEKANPYIAQQYMKVWLEAKWLNFTEIERMIPHRENAFTHKLKFNKFIPIE